MQPEMSGSFREVISDLMVPDEIRAVKDAVNNGIVNNKIIKN